MIVTARNPDEWAALSGFLKHYAHVNPSADMQFIGYVSEGKLVMVIGFSGFVGKLAQIHVAYADGWHFTPRSMLRAVFRYGFITAGRELLVGIVNSKNVRAMRMDLHLGFREMYRIPGMHDDGGDFVVLGMKKSECRYLDEPERGEVVIAQVGSA